MTPKRVLILGSTGSIGQNSLEVLAGLRDQFEVVGLAADKNSDVLSQQIRTWQPAHAAMTDPESATALRAKIDTKTQVLTGPQALVDLVDTVEFDCVVVAVVGAAGLPATIRAVELGKRVAIANKESLVVAGPLLTELAAKTGAELIPIDSEHSAVFQALHAGNPEDVARIILTGSGGPFRTWAPERVAAATLEDALNHPIWDMGPKITIDSATMMNKALEIVEARWLFGLNPDQIDVIIHPESIIHSMVEFRDGSVVAQLGTPDMRTPIQYALTYPERRVCPSPRLDFAAIGEMSFEEPDSELFPALRLGHEVARRGGTAGAVFSAANESAVQLFRDGEIGFADITRAVERVLSRHEWNANPTLDVLRSADAWARDEVHKCTAC
jgi:1-deoxy-D-xylulose-5-phosphate reductoisomerase